jgi:hypothetical protein
MGNITIGGNKILTITSASSKSLIIQPVEPSLPIVQTMELSYELSDNQWLFSLNGLTENVKDIVDAGGKIYVQLVTDRGQTKITGRDTSFFREPRSGRRPNFPNKIRDDYPGRFNINTFENNFYTNMNLTNWMNGLIAKLSVIRSSGNNPVRVFKSNNGYWFVNVRFCIRVESNTTAQVADTNQYIKLNFYNNDDENINTNYSLVNNEIDIYSL